MKDLKNSSVVIAGCARDCAPHLPAVLHNLERIAGLFGRAAFVIVEDGSSDDTRELLRDWLSRTETGRLLGPEDRAAGRQGLRTERIASARNEYLDFIRASELRGYEHLVVVDLDDVNARALDLGAFASAVRFLAADPAITGVFANSDPVYFDIWALRHPDWCPNDCWAEARTAQGLTREQAIERYVYSRQVALADDTLPILVHSAFGGLGIYRLAPAIASRYSGLTSVGTEVCEHVPFNLELSSRGKLYIFPKLRNSAPLEHLRDSRPRIAARVMRLHQNGRQCDLLAPPEHRLDSFRKSFPLYDRRLPELAALMSMEDAGGAVIDVGANIGDTVALCRLAGCSSHIVAIEPSDRFFAFLEANSRSRPELFANVQLVQAAIGGAGERLRIDEHHGTASSSRVATGTVDADVPGVRTVSLEEVHPGAAALIKIDTDGYDAMILLNNVAYIRDRAPVLWVETDLQSDLGIRDWEQALAELAESHDQVCAFDNFGFLVTHGRTRDKTRVILDLIDYGWRHKRLPREQVGEPRVHYLDLALFSPRHSAVYRRFVESLVEGPESSAATATA